MKTKILAAVLFALVLAVSAGDIVRFDFNCYGSDADIVPVGQLPDGVRIGKKAPFNNPKIVGRATPLIIDIDKVSKLEHSFTVHGKSGRIVPSLIPWRGKDGSMPTVECTKLELNGTPSPKTPIKFADWVNMGIKIDVNDGDTLSLKLELKPSTASLFPGIRSTDRAAVAAAAQNGPTAYHRIMGKIRLAQLDTPEAVDAYAKQAVLIDKLLADEGVKDPTLKFCVPLCTPQGVEIWTPEGWHAAHEAGSFREMSYLTNTVESVKYARAELGDEELFRRYVSLLDKFFPEYGWGAVHTAIQFMRPLLPAVDSEQAAEALTRIRERVAAVAGKDPAKWNQTLAMIDQMLGSLKK